MRLGLSRKQWPKLKSSGYQITARIIAASEHDSVAGIFRRYEEQKAAKGFGRWSNIKAHNEAYVGVPVTVGLIEDHCFADRVEVYNRRGVLLYANILEQGGWSQKPQGAAVIQAERNRCPTVDEVRQRESEWSTVLTMMSARRAAELDIQIVRNVAGTYLHCEYQANASSYHDEILRRVSGLRRSNEQPVPPIPCGKLQTQQFSVQVTLIVSIGTPLTGRS